MQRQCEQCGKPFEAQRPTAKYCSGSCRTRRARSGDPAPPARKLDKQTSGLVDAVRTELEAADRLSTVAGQHALELANRIVGAPGMNTGVASLSKQLQVVLAEALKGAAKTVTPLDELRARRDAKRATG